MPNYRVDIPFTGYTSVVVTADSKKDAIAAAYEHPLMNIDECMEVEFHDIVSQGNVTHAVLNEISVEETDDDADPAS